MSANETVHTSATGGQKAGNDVRPSLIPPDELLEVAQLYGKGAAKYSDGNWRKGYPWHLSFDALCRHLFAWWGGEEFDNGDGGTGQEHLDAVVFHALALKWFRKHRPQFDDRPHVIDAAAALSAPRGPRVVDALGVNERDAQWTGKVGQYRWDADRFRWMRLPIKPWWPGDWMPTVCVTGKYGPFTEVLPRVVNRLGVNERDFQWTDNVGDAWAWLPSSDSPDGEWQYQHRGDDEDDWMTTGNVGDVPDFHGYGPFTERLP